ncbi:MAG: aminoacyl-tRNA hydrolase [Acidobacteriaceae bacterium]|nr:aminoacyl-tRNA hydrolase [Acidobacteriaceae bacterium]
MKLIVGLGNPGIQYQFTPHNAGFLAIDRIAERCNAVVANRRSKALTATANLAGFDVVLAKPETYMNLSGIAIAALAEELEIDPLRDLIVLYDEVDLPLGSLRVRERGSSAGHNGAKSVTGALGSDEWLRVRIGVSPEDEETASRVRRRSAEYVLTPFRKKELVVLDEVLDRVADAVEVVLREGAGAAMNRFNRREEPAE